MQFFNLVASVSVLLAATPGLVNADPKFTKQVVTALNEMRDTIDKTFQGQLMKPAGYPLTVITIDKPLQTGGLPKESPGLAINRLLSYRSSIRQTVQKVSDAMLKFRGSTDPAAQVAKNFHVTLEDRTWANMYLNMYMAKNYDLKGFTNRKMKYLVHPGVFQKEFNAKSSNGEEDQWCTGVLKAHDYWKAEVSKYGTRPRPNSGEPSDQEDEWNDYEDKYWVAKQRLNQCKMKGVQGFEKVNIEVGPGGGVRD